MAREYPAHREADIVLRDGSTVRVRPVRTDDEPALLAFLKGLSGESLWLRFFTGSANLERAAYWAAQVDYEDRYGFVALSGLEEKIVGHAYYVKTDHDRAEVAFEVAEDYQGRGLGTILLSHLAEVADESSIVWFEGEVLPQNHRMIELFRQSGYDVRMHSEPGVIRCEFPIQVGVDAIERFEYRERVAAVAAVCSFLEPRSVALIGAGRERGSIGGEIFHNLLDASFTGPVYPVNPKAEVVQSVVAYPSLKELPGSVDLAVISVPAVQVSNVARECAAKGVRSLVVISSGFNEVGDEGAERQRELLEICRETGMRLVGPNCMGVLNTSPEVQLNATFAPVFPPAGRVGFLSQSGALGLAVIDAAQNLGLGISSFVSVGNKADISGNDLIQYWEEDGNTDLILLYLESFGNPRKFARIARRVAREKPIVVVKSGRSKAGARATSSHTGALLAASDATFDALFRQTGVIRTDTLGELFDVASLLANQPPPAGNRVAIVTNAGGLGILCADACEANRLEVPALPQDLQDRLGQFLPAEASAVNPVDMIASATSEDYRRTIIEVAACEEIDALIVIFIPPLETRGPEVALAIRAAARELPREIPLLTVFMSRRGLPEELSEPGLGIPSYSFPEDAARALARAAAYGSWRGQPEGGVPRFEDVRSDEAAGVLATALVGGPRWLLPEEVERFFDCYGLPMVSSRRVTTADEAGEAAEELGGRLVLKAVAAGLVHKTEAGGVRLGLEGREEVTQAARQMGASVTAAGHRLQGYLVQQMVPAGVEMLVGVVHDPSFGPVLACGAGGTAVEVLKDISVRITPISDRDAGQMLRALRTFPLLQGYRGAPAADVGGLEELLLRVSALVEMHPEVAEMECNPVMATPEGPVIVDARVRVEVAEPGLSLKEARPGLGVARLRQ